jgi:ABC-type sugar transport system permease subunit
MKFSVRSYLVFLPILLVILAFLGIPIAEAIYYAFIHLKLAVPDPRNGEFVGLANFFDAFSGYDFQRSLMNTVIIGMTSTFGILGLALAVALVAGSRFKGRSLYRALIVLPWAVSASVAGQQFKYMLQPSLSPFAAVLVWLGLIPDIGAFTPLSTPAGAIISVIITTIWKNASFVSMLLLAGLQSIPGEYYEAARVDGAGTLQVFRKITFPLLLPFINIGMLFSAIVAGTLIDIIYPLTLGGPGISTQNISFELYKIYFQFWNFGVGGAISVFLLAYSFILMIPLIRSMIKHVMGI